MKKCSKCWLSFALSLVLGLTAFSQEDSLIVYFNRATPADLVAGERLLQKYTSKDSIKLAWIASKVSSKENKVKFYHTAGHRFYMNDDYETTRGYYFHALEIAQLTLDKRIIADQLAEQVPFFHLFLYRDTWTVKAI